MKKQILFLILMALMTTLPQQMTANDVVIDSTTFPDENFRNWVLEQDYGLDGVLTDEEIAAVTNIRIYTRS